METCEDGGCPGPHKSLSSRAGPAATKGQAGDGPEPAELRSVPATAAPGTAVRERNAEMELEKARMEFELTRLRYLHEENERQRQHEEAMEHLQQQATPRLVGDRSRRTPRLRDTRGEGSPSLTCTGSLLYPSGGCGPPYLRSRLQSFRVN